MVSTSNDLKHYIHKSHLRGPCPSRGGGKLLNRFLSVLIEILPVLGSINISVFLCVFLYVNYPLQGTHSSIYTYPVLHFAFLI